MTIQSIRSNFEVMNVEEERFKRVYYKVQVPEALISPLSFRLKYAGFYFSFLWLFITIFFLWNFISNLTQQDFVSFYETDKSTVGVVTAIDFTYDSESEDTTFIYNFVYTDKAKKYTNKGYYGYKVYDLNDSIKIFYKVENPAIAKAEYLNASKNETPSLTICFGIMFLLFGIGFLYHAEQKNNLLVSTLKNGVLTLGFYQSHTSDSDSNDFTYKYEYMDRNKKCYYIFENAPKDEIIFHIDVLYSDMYPNKAFIIHKNFLRSRFNRDTIIQLVHEYATEIENA